MLYHSQTQLNVIKDFNLKVIVLTCILRVLRFELLSSGFEDFLFIWTDFLSIWTLVWLNSGISGMENRLDLVKLEANFFFLWVLYFQCNEKGGKFYSQNFVTNCKNRAA